MNCLANESFKLLLSTKNKRVAFGTDNGLVDLRPFHSGDFYKQSNLDHFIFYFYIIAYFND